MTKNCFLGILVLFLVLSHAQAQSVKVTPLGSRTGEFCGLDRASMFEDPTGVQILYDPGFTVAGGTDPRLGAVHVILVSHGHGDHLGAGKLSHDPDAASAPCTFGFPTASALPHSNVAEIGAAKNSAVIVGGNMASFLNGKMAALKGTPIPSCPGAGIANELTVPRTTPCTGGLGISGKRTVTMEAGTPGVEITLVPANHDNSLSSGFLSEPVKSALAGDRLAGYLEPANGYILKFTNGLTVYLSGDTGFTGEMGTVVRDLYGANLAVMNIGDIFTLGPDEAAFAVKRLIKPKAVIPSHANEAATAGGVVNLGTRTARFIDAVEGIRVHVPRSSITMEFDRHGRCLIGCY